MTFVHMITLPENIFVKVKYLFLFFWYSQIPYKNKLLKIFLKVNKNPI